jgi:hypothetical protein
MDTRRTQIDRILDAASGNVTIETLKRVAGIVGRELRVELLRILNPSFEAHRPLC